MGIFDALLGRTKPVPSNLDALFGIPSASITLQTAAGLVCSGRAGVCYKPPSGQGIEQMQGEIDRLLTLDGGAPGATSEDAFGYRWVVVTDPDIEALVTRVHLVNSSLADAGWGPQLLCSVFGVAPAPATDPEAPPTAGPGAVLASTSYLVYLFKRGTFYPFVPAGHEQRSTEDELRLRSLVAGDLRMEDDLERWFPLWDLPVG
jgi:hypothetical protein